MKEDVSEEIRRFSEAADELNRQLERAFKLIHGRKLGTPAVIGVGEYAVGLAVLQGKWQFYFVDAEGLRKPITSAPILVRIAFGQNLMALWEQVLANHEAKRDSVVKSAEMASEFCVWMEEAAVRKQKE
jgi:hypothetical protein